MRPEFKYGFGAGLVWVFWNAIEYLLGFRSTHFQAGEYGAWMDQAIQLAMLILLLRAVHRRLPLGRLEPWDAALRSLFASAIFAVLIYAGTVAFVNFIDPGWLTQMLTWKVALLRERGVSEEAIRRYIDATRDAYSGLGLARSVFIIFPLVGAVAGILICVGLNWRWEKVHLASP